MLAEPLLTNTLFVLAGIGLAVSILSALENQVAWIAKFCTFFGQGCARTAEFTLFQLPVAWWGIAFYLALLAALGVAQPLVFWIVFAGLGFELTFGWILVSKRIMCIFCATNAVVVAAMAVAAFDPARFWQAATVALAAFIASNALIRRENPAELGEQECETVEEGVMARVEDEPVTEHEIERRLVIDLHELEKRLYKRKKQCVEDAVREKLLEREAARRGMTVSGLVNTDALTGFEMSKEERQNKVALYADSLRDKYDVELLIDEPSLPCTPLRVGDSPALGPEDADVVVVEFSDYLCPACRQAHEVAAELKQAFAGRIRWVFMDFPLPMHQGADKMAEAAHCAREQDAFWEYQDRMFEVDGYPEPEGLVKIAAELGLDEERFRDCLESGKMAEKVERAVAEGRSAGVSATPTFFVNGHMQRGCSSFEEFKALIEEEMEAAGGQNEES